VSTNEELLERKSSDSGPQMLHEEYCQNVHVSKDPRDLEKYLEANSGFNFQMSLLYTVAHIQSKFKLIKSLKF
jgi:hypothetical protein